MRTLIRVFLLGMICLPMLTRAEKTAPPFFNIIPLGPTTGCPSLSLSMLPDYYDNPMDLYVSWDWDFGDGETSTQFNPTHIFTREGNFTVSVVITKASGHKDTITEVGFVQVFNSFNVDLGPDVTICSGSSIVLDATISGASGYEWEDGSNTPSTERFFEGEYSVAVTKDGCVDRDTIYVTQNAVLTADFDYAFTPGCAPIATSFTEMSESCTGAIVEWDWDFGDGGTSTEQNPEHNYMVPGDYLVTLTVKNSIGSVYSMNKTVTIEGAVMPTVELGDDQVICEGFTGTLVATGSGGTYAWSTGESTSSITVDATGKYYVTVSVDGCEASDTVNVSILPDLIVDFTATKLSSCLPMRMKYTNKTVFCESEVDSWLWNFDDGTTSTEESPEHVFTTAGQFRVRLTVMLKSGLSSDKMRRTVVSPMIFNIDLGPDSTICEGETIALDAGMSGMTYEWSTGETTQQIVAGFEGEYAVKMTFDGCEAKDTINVSTVSSANIKYGYEVQSECLPVEVKFTDSTSLKCGQTVTSWKWEFGDGQVSFDQHPSHNYQTADSFVVRLTIMTSGGSMSTSTKKVGVKNTPLTVDIPSQVKVCGGNSAVLDAGISDAQYSWYPSEGLNNPAVKSPIVTPSATGWYHVDVTKCMVTATDSIYVVIDNVNKPVITQSGGSLKTSDATSYEWYREGQKIDGSDAKIIRLDKQGYYSVKVFNDMGCENQSDTSFFTPFPGGGKGNVKVMCTPNPSPDGLINVLFAELPAKPARVSIYDTRGIRVLTTQVSNHRNLINAQKLAGGLYLVEVIFDNQRVTIPVAVQ